MVEKGHVVEEYKDGSTVIKICDDCCKNTTPEQVEEILERIAKKALEHFNRKREE